MYNDFRGQACVKLTTISSGEKVSLDLVPVEVLMPFGSPFFGTAMKQSQSGWVLVAFKGRILMFVTLCALLRWLFMKTGPGQRQVEHKPQEYLDKMFLNQHDYLNVGLGVCFASPPAPFIQFKILSPFIFNRVGQWHTKLINQCDHNGGKEPFQLLM